MVFLPILQFIYKGKISVPFSQLSGLLEAASSLKVKGIFPQNIPVIFNV